MTGGVELTQEDRDAAAAWAKLNSRNAQAANMKRGSCDTAPLVQTFARHRLASTSAAQSRIRVLEEAAAAVCSGCAEGVPLNSFGYHQQGVGYTFPCVASAILALLDGEGES